MIPQNRLKVKASVNLANIPGYQGKLMSRRSSPGIVQSEEKRSALARYRFGPQPPLVPCDDTLGYRQSYADTGKFVIAVQALEGQEQFSPICHIETHAVVFHEKDLTVGSVPGANGNMRHLFTLGELHRIS